MVDTTTEPGAPSAKGASDAAAAASGTPAVASNNASVAKQIDRTILRLNKLLTNPGGLSAFLSTFNYTLYVLAYLQSKSPTLANHARTIIALVRAESARQPASTTILVADGAVPPIAALAGLVSRARTTLRLFGLLPLYAWLKSLKAGPKAGADPVLHRIAVTQCLSYIGYQALENICVLADNGVVSKKFIALINRGDATTARLYLWAYRAWFSGIICDFLRLGREAQIEKRRRTERVHQGTDVAVYEQEDKKIDAKWWTDLMIASAWAPMAYHFSSTTGGIPGWNLGWMGLCGLVAGSSRAKGHWRATVHP